jgi:hypothetical protein
MENNKIDDGGPAFPCPEASLVHYNYPTAYMGLTMRDVFAAAALQGMMGNRSLVDTFSGHAVMAEKSYFLADAMIKVKKENI